MICTGSYDEFMYHPNGISISGDKGRGKQYPGPAYTKLAPKKIWWDEWEQLKDSMNFYESVIYYMEKYYETVLSQLEPKEVFDELDGKVLLCYEESKEFCHRHIVATWLELTLGVTVPEVRNLGEKLVVVPRPEYIKELLPLVLKKFNTNPKKLSKQNEQFTPIKN